MMGSPQGRSANVLPGQVLRRSERREVAIFLRDGALWIADFVDGDGAIVEATTWFRFNCAARASTHAWRRMVLESAIPLSDSLVDRILRLPHPGSPRKVGRLVRLIEALSARGRRRFRRSGAPSGVSNGTARESSE